MSGARITRRSVLHGIALGGLAGGISAAGFPVSARAQDFKGQTVNWLVTQPRIGAAQKLKEMFEALTGAKVEITAIPFDASESQATIDVSSGANRFDVIDYWYASIGAMAENGILMDVTDKIAAEEGYIKPADFLPPFYDNYTLYGGRRYGLPWDGDSHSLFYNAELLEKHKCDVPQTWDQYLETARKITEEEKGSGIYGAIMMGVNVPVALGSGYVNRIAGYQGRLLTEDNKSALLEETQIMAAKNLAAVIPYCFPTPPEVGFENGIPAFLSGRGALIEFWTDLGIHAENDPNSAIKGKWGVTSLPVGKPGQEPRAALDGGWGLGISMGSKNKDLAWEFMKWATSPDVQREVSSTPGTFSDPVRDSVLSSKEYGDFAPKVQKAQILASKKVMPWPTIPESPQLMRSLTDELAKMIAGQQSPEETMEKTDREWRRLLG